MLDSAEVVIIGGGVIGTSTAYYLAREGVDVALVERGDLASGSSGQCNGGVVCGAEPVSPLTTYSNELYAQLASELDMDFHYRRGGSYRLIETEADWHMMEEIVAKQASRGLPVNMIGREELLRREPNIAPHVLGAVEYPTDATLNPIRFCWAAAQGAARRGARVHRFTEVRAIEVTSRNEVAKVSTSRGDIAAKIVVNAAGCWAPAIGAMVGVNIPIIPRRGQIVVTEAAAPVVGRKLNEAGGIRTQLGMKLSELEREEAAFGVAFVCERTVDGNVLIGGSREFVGFDTRTTPEVIRAIVRRALRFVPKLSRLNCIRTYAGLRPFTPDHLPIISPIDKVKGFYIAAGHEGDGISLAPLTGKAITDMVTGRETCIDLRHLAFSRFQAEGSDVANC